MIRALVLILVCGSPALGQTTPPADAAESSNRYAFACLAGMVRATPGNFCFSPHSTHQVGGVLLEAATGTAETELQRLTQLSADPADRAAQNLDLRKRMAAISQDQDCFLEITTSLWAQPAAQFQPDFVTRAKTQFGADLRVLPPGGPVTAAAEVNRFVREKTQGRITHLVGPANFSEQEHSLLILNTLLLKAVWEHHFDRRFTREQPFTDSKGSAVPWPMMQQTSAFRYADEVDSWQAVELPFAGQTDLRMVVLLPADPNQRTLIEEGLTAAVWSALLVRLAPTEVQLHLPKFSFATELNFKPLWQALGVETLFDRNRSTLTQLGTLPDPYHVTALLHQATIEVDEIGAIATAATAAPADPFGDAPTTAPPKVKIFNANRPFLWFIHHAPSQLILFTGRFAASE